MWHHWWHLDFCATCSGWILVLDSGDISHDPACVKWFQRGRWWWLFLEVIPCRLSGPTATLHGTSGMFLSGDVSFPVKSSPVIPHPMVPLGTEELFEKPGWLVRWRRGTGLCLWQEAIKLCLDLGKGGRDALWLIQPSLIMHTPPCNLGV